MAKHATCDECGSEITWRDMNNGEFEEIVNYHPACAHISTMKIIFERDVSLTPPAPDLCKTCMIKHLLRGLGFSKKELEEIVSKHKERDKSRY